MESYTILQCQAVLLVTSGLVRYRVQFEGFGAGLSMEYKWLAVDNLRVWLAGYQPAAVCSASKLASFQGLRSVLGVEVHKLSVDGFGIRVEGDDSFTVTAFGTSHIHLLFATNNTLIRV